MADDKKVINSYTPKTQIEDTDSLILQESGGTTKRAEFSSIKASMGSQGWIDAGETWTYASADSPTFTVTVAGDKSTKYSKGMKFKLDQIESLTNYWSFDTDSTEEIAGVTMTNVGTPTYTAGKFGNALTLNGSSQALKCDDNTFKPVGDFTIGVWIKTSTVSRSIFQSYAGVTNYAGITLTINSSGCIEFFVGSNDSLVFGKVIGKVVITDNIWHYVVVTNKKNFGQIYIDGILDNYEYLPIVGYQTPHYVRIGCSNTSGTNGDYYSGQIDDLYLKDGYALSEETIKEKYILNTAQGIDNFTINKKFILTDIIYSTPNTTLTIYGGTDYSLTNSVITNVYYSISDTPFGFTKNKTKWSVISYGGGTVNSPNPSVVYNVGNWSISVPIGIWDVCIEKLNISDEASSATISIYLSESNTALVNTLNIYQNYSTLLYNNYYPILNVKYNYINKVKKTLYFCRTNNGSPSSLGSTGYIMIKSIWV